MKKILICLFILSNYIYSTSIFVPVGILNKNVQNKRFLDLTTKVLAKEINKTGDIVKLKVYDNENKFLRDYIDKNIKIVVAHPFFYFNNKSFLDKHTKEMWLANINEYSKQEYYLIANEKAKNVLDNLKKYNLITFDSTVNPMLWYKYIYYIKYKSKYTKIKHQQLTKESKIIYKVFFNKDTIAVISKPTYELMLELNPQLKKNIQIVKKSRNIFIEYLGFNNNSVTDEEKDILLHATKKISSIMGASQLSDAASIGIFLDYDKNDLKVFNDFYIEFKKLEKKYE